MSVRNAATNTKLVRRAAKLGLLFVLLVWLRTKTMTEKNSDLDLCPHSGATYSHRWHGLPLEGCGGSHLDADDAKRSAKPFVSKTPTRNLDGMNLNLALWNEILRDYFDD